MSSPQPQVVSDWAPTDQSTNHIELALTDKMINSGRNGQQQLVELRSSHDPDQFILVTPNQVQAFARSTSTQDSPAGRLLAAATGRS